MSLAVMILTLFLSINAIGLIIGSIIYEEASSLPAYSHPGDPKAAVPLKYKGREMYKEILSLNPLMVILYPEPLFQPCTNKQKPLFLSMALWKTGTAGLNYLSLYMQSGFNLLLIDSRITAKAVVIPLPGAICENMI